MVNKHKSGRRSSHADETADETSDFSSKMDNKPTHSRTRRRSTRSRPPTEDVSLAEDEEMGVVAPEARDNGFNGDTQPVSRATSLSELTEPDPEPRPAKRAKSKRSMPNEDMEMSRASSPLSVDDGSVNGQVIDFNS